MPRKELTTRTLLRMVCVFRHFLLDAGCSRLTGVILAGSGRLPGCSVGWMIVTYEPTSVAISSMKPTRRNARRLLIILLC